ncbi:hypothetical protein BGX34_005224 [Mortierella sp. NVP85]|nr:hypothetical protein BGX34_005224 [Mortierella sp. NVP85]
MDHDHITQASKGSVFAANVNSQRRWFNVEDIQFEANDDPNVIGVINEETVLDIRLRPISDQGSLHLRDGMEELTRDISGFVVDSLQRVDAYARLNIPNMKAVIVTGVTGSGKKSVVRSWSRLYVAVKYCFHIISGDRTSESSQQRQYGNQMDSE